MKKVFTSLFLLMLGVMATYATDYDLYVCGTRVTSSNAGSIATGVKYDASSTTLTLTNCTLDGGSNYAIRNEGITNLKIKIVGSCTVKANTDAIYLKAVTEINGVFGICGTLNVESTSPTGAAIWVKEGSTLRLYNLWLTATGKNYCLFGDGNETLSLSCCVMTAKCTSSTPYAGAVHGFSSASFDAGDAYLTTGAFNSSANAVCESSSSTDELYTVKTDASLIVGSSIVRIGETTWDLTPTQMTAGSITYANSSKTLTFDNVTMNVGSDEAVNNKKIDGLIVKSVGTNKITGSASSGSVFRTDKNMTLKGDVNNDLGKGFQLETCYLGLWACNNSEITFDNVVFVAAAERGGIRGDAGSNLKKLTVKQSLIATYGKEYGAITGVQDCTLDGCSMFALFSPGICYRKALKGFGTADALTTGEDAVLIAVPTENYNVSVLGTPVNNANYTGIAVDGLTAGSIVFDKDSKTLTLDGVKMTAPEGNTTVGIFSNGGGVQKVALSGNNEITTNGNVFQLYGDVLFEGDGKLIATSSENNGISMYQFNNSASITINVNNTVKFFGKKRGVWGYVSSSTTSNLELKKAGNSSDYYFKGETDGAVIDFNDLLLTDMDFYTNTTWGTPGTYFYNNNVRQNGGTLVKGDNVVNFYRLNEGDRYGIKIGGTEITACNMYGVGSKFITAGGAEAVTYSGGTLTLNGATIAAESTPAVWNTTDSGIDGLTVNVTGENKLSSTDGSFSLVLGKTATVKGTGSLTCDVFNAGKNSNITFKDINFTALNQIHSNMSGAKITFDLTTAGKRIKAADGVYGFDKIIMANGTKIVEPEGAKLNDAYTAIVTTSGATATNVVIGDASATGIEGVIMNPDAEVQGIFDAEGRQLNEMQPGVNILRMSDGTTRKVIKK